MRGFKGKVKYGEGVDMNEEAGKKQRTRNDRELRDSRIRKVSQRRGHYSLNGRQRGELEILYLIVWDPNILS